MAHIGDGSTSGRLAEAGRRKDGKLFRPLWTVEPAPIPFCPSDVNPFVLVAWARV